MFFRRTKSRTKWPTRRRRNSSRLRMEQLEDRRMLTLTLNINGTAADDTILFDYVQSQRQIQYSVNGTVSVLNVPPELSSIVIHGFQGADTIRVLREPGLPLVINGGGGDDVIIIGQDAGRMDSLSFNVFYDIRGGEGQDTVLVLDNASTIDIRPYFISTDWVARGAVGSQPVSHQIGLDSIEIINVASSPLGNEFFIANMPAEVSVNIFDAGGADTLIFGSAGSTLDTYLGQFSYEQRSTTSLQSSVNFHDQASLFSGNYGIQATADRTTLTRGSARFAFRNVGTFELNAGAGSTNFNVDSTQPGTNWSIDAGAGNDRLRVTPGREIGTPNVPIFLGGSLDAIQGNLNFTAGLGQDEVFIDDAFSRKGRVFDIANQRVEWGDGRRITLGSVEEITVYSSDRDDQFRLGAGALYGNMSADVNIASLGGTNEVFIDDGQGTKGDYFFDAFTDSLGVEGGWFQKVTFQPGLGIPFPRSGVLTTRGIDSVRLETAILWAQELDVQISGTPTGQDLILNGGPGSAEIVTINLPRIRSDVQLNARGPHPIENSPSNIRERITLIGDREQTVEYVPGPDNRSGTITVPGVSTITFQDYERLSAQSIGDLRIITPRSRDTLAIEGGVPSYLGDTQLWTRVSGTSGVSPRTIAALHVRDIGTLTVDVVANDITPDPDTELVNPNDVVRLLPGSLSGNNVELLRLIMGIGEDELIDEILLGPPATTALERVSITPVKHTAFGVADRVEMGSLRAYNADGLLLHDVRNVGPGRMVLVDEQPLVTYSGRDVNLTLDAGPEGYQRFRSSHSATSWEFQTTASGHWEIEAKGDSEVAIIAILVKQSPLFLGGAGDDSLTFQVDSGLSLQFPLVLEGFDGRDTIMIDGLRQIGQGQPVETDFQVDARNAFGLVDPALLIELLVHLGPSVAGFELPLGGAQTYPKVALTGHGLPNDSVDVKAPLNSGFTAIELMVREVKLAGIELLVAEAADRIRVTQDNLGGLLAVAEIDAVSTVNVRTDNFVRNVTLDALRTEIIYSPEFRSVSFDNTRATELLVKPKFTEIIGVLMPQIEHFVTPTVGRVQIGNLDIAQDPYARTTLVGADIESRISGDFNGTLSIDHLLTGSTSALRIDGASLNGLNFRAQGFDGAINKVAADIRNSVIEGPVTISYVAPDSGENFLVTNVTGTHFGSGGFLSTNTDTGGSPTTVLNLSSNNTTLLGGGWQQGLDTRGGSAVVLTGAAPERSANELVGIIGVLKPPPQGIIGVLMPPREAIIGVLREGIIGVLNPGWEANLLDAFSSLGPKTAETGVVPEFSAPLSHEVKLMGAGQILVVAYDASQGGTFIAPETFGGEVMVVGEGNVTVGAAPLLGTGIETELPVHLCLVTNTNDAGPGSLRAAIECANEAPEGFIAVIAFAIPETDSGFIDIDTSRPGGDLDPDVFVIGISTPLPALTRGNILINGQSQQTLTGDSNPFGPEIVLVGQGLELLSSDNRVHGLTIVIAAANGILIEGNGNVVTGSYIGVAPTGLVEAPNTLDGVQIRYGDGNRIGGTRPGDRNVIAANGRFGVLIEGNSFAWPGPGDPPFATDNPDMFRFAGNTVVGNSIGLAADGVTTLGNGGSGFGAGLFVVNSANNVIDGNTVSGNLGDGITIVGGHDNRIQNNHVGTTIDGLEPAGNTGQGLRFAEGTQRNRVIDNVVSGNLQNGIVVDGGHTRTQAEGFDSLLNTFFNGWTGFRNQENRDNFGYSDGEAGGTFARASSTLGETIDHVSYYADTNVGRFTLNDELRASGKLIFSELNNFDGSVQIGYFNTEDAHANRVQSVLSLRVAEPNPRVGTTGIRVFAEIALANGTRVFGTPVNAGDGLERNVSYTWELYYNPGSGANRQGGLEVRVFADGELVGTSFVSLTASHRTIGASFDAFGLHQGGESVRSSNPNTITLYVDNLRYTHVADGHTFHGNFIGTRKLGDSALPNGASGVVLAYAAPSQVGGTEPGQANVISGNISDGIRIVGGSGNNVQQNIIGLDAAGSSSLANSGNGVRILQGATGNRIRDNVISSNRGSGVSLEGSATTGNLIADNLIGTDASGELDRGNAIMGVWIIQSPNNTVRENLISGNEVNGLVIAGANATGNLATGNFIGTDLAGAFAIGNVLGVHIADAPNNRVIGNLLSGNVVGLDISGATATGNLAQGNFIGTGPGGAGPLGNTADGVFIDNAPGNTLQGNTIAANGFNGVMIAGNLASGNVLRGNFIGIDALGNALGNSQRGILLTGAQNARIGDSTPSGGNIIAANKLDGIRIVGGSRHTIQGNLIGTDVSGTIAIANLGTGIAISNATEVLIGGTDPDAGNVISGNRRHAIHLLDGSGHTVQGNVIGTDGDGTSAIPNGQALPNAAPAVFIERSRDNQIGGGASGAGNLISGNFGYGVAIFGDGAHGNRIQGNRIGTDASGTAAVPNFSGVVIGNGNASGNVIGVDGDGIDDAGEGNLISGHVSATIGSTFGIVLSGTSGSTGNIAAGNKIGTDITGTLAIPNSYGIWMPGAVDNRIESNLIAGNLIHGIQIDSNGHSNSIAGNWIGLNAAGESLANLSGVRILGGAGSNELRSNFISGNRQDGIAIAGGAGNVIRENLIGLNSTGQEAHGNAWNGIAISGAANDHQILDNVISANGRSGVLIEGAAASGNLLEGNRIGTDSAGELDRGNGIMGVWIIGAPGNTIAENLISGNAGNGLVIAGVNAWGNRAERNLIGTDLTGTWAIGNVLGIHIADAPENKVIGNLLSGNVVGLDISGATASKNVVQRNYIGTTANGNSPLPNKADGIFIDGAPENLIGGLGQDEGNVIAANGFRGIYIEKPGSFGNLVQGNRIGSGADGITPLGNMLAGIEIAGGSDNRVLDNSIANNRGSGVVVVGALATGNTIRRNAIHSNSGLGIDLGGDGVTPNDNGNLAVGVFPDTDAGPNGLQNFPELQNVQRGVQTRVIGLLRSTPGTSFVIDFYASSAPDPSGHGEGQRWLGNTTVIANGEGVARFNATLAATTYGGEFVTATATRILPDGRESDTSEFSAAFAVKAGKGVPGPNSFTLELLSASDAYSTPLIASGLDVQLVGVADLAGEFSPLNVATFTPTIMQGPEGLPMSLAAHSSMMSPLLLDAVSRASQFGQDAIYEFKGRSLEFARWNIEGGNTSDPWARSLPRWEHSPDGRRQFTMATDQLLSDDDLDWLSELVQGEES